MLRRGFIATSSVYVLHNTTDSILDMYETAIDEVFSILGDAIKNNKILEHLESNIRSYVQASYKQVEYIHIQERKKIEYKILKF